MGARLATKLQITDERTTGFQIGYGRQFGCAGQLIPFYVDDGENSLMDETRICHEGANKNRMYKGNHGYIIADSSSAPQPKPRYELRTFQAAIW